MPRFSIVMPCFNAAETLNETITSILEQSFQDWELICIDDGSTDTTRFLLDEYVSSDHRIKWVANQGKGPSSARNFGAMTLAQGEIIAFCDADDIWCANKLAQLDVAFETEEVDLFFGQIGFFEVRPDAPSTLSTVPDADLTIAMLLGENPVCTLSNASIRRASLLAFGGFDPDVVHNEDLEWLVRLVGQGAVLRGIDRLQVLYRASLTGLSANLPAMAEGRRHAIATALRFGVPLPRTSEAIYQRYLARRALRIGQSRWTAAHYAVRGMVLSPKGFMSPPRRGALTLLAALTNFFLPRALSRALFC